MEAFYEASCAWPSEVRQIAVMIVKLADKNHDRRLAKPAVSGRILHVGHAFQRPTKAWLSTRMRCQSMAPFSSEKTMAIPIAPKASGSTTISRATIR